MTVNVSFNVYAFHEVHFVLFTFFAKWIYLGDLLTLISINECRLSYPTRFGSKADDLFSNDCRFLISSSPLTQRIVCFHLGSSALTQGSSTCILFRVLFKEVRFGLYYYLVLLFKKSEFWKQKISKMNFVRQIDTKLFLSSKLSK